MLGQCSRRYSLASSMVIPSTPGPPMFCRTRFHALTRFSRLHTSSIDCSVSAELSVAGFATNGSAPWDLVAAVKNPQYLDLVVKVEPIRQRFLALRPFLDERQ